MRMLILAIVLMQAATPQQGARTPEDIERETPPGQVIRLAPTPDNPETDGPVIRVPVRIVGEVKKPGSYYMSGYTVPDLIEAAGGFTDKAKRNAIVFHRGVALRETKPMIVAYDYKGKGVNIRSKGVIVFPGDTIDVWSVDDPDPQP